MSHYCTRASCLLVAALATVPHSSTGTTINHGALGLTFDLLIKHHQQQCLPLILGQNPSPEPPTFLPLSQISSVARGHSFCSQSRRRRSAAVIQEKGPIPIGAGDHRARHQRSADCVLYCFLTIGLSSYKEKVLYFLFINFMLYQHKIQTNMFFPFHFRVTDSSHLRLRKPLKACNNLHCQDLSVCV